MAGLHFPITADNANFMRALHEVTASVRDASRQIEADGGGIDRTISRIKMGLATLGVGLGFKEITSQVASTRGEFQQLEVAFKTMLGSEEKATELMSQLVRTAAITPFDLQGVANGAKQLLAYGVSADEVNQRLIQLGDIAAGLSIPLNDLVYLYGTTLTQGRMFTQDLRQFQGRGIPIADELAKQFGVAKDKVGELVTAGKVGSKEFIAAIDAMTGPGSKFGGLMEAQSATISGQISNIEDAIDTMLNEIGKSSEGLINTTLDVTSSLVENWQTVLAVLGDIAAAYGVQKAVLALDTGFTKAATNYGYDAEIEQLKALIPLEEEEQKTALQQAVAAGNLTEAKAAEVVALREEANAQLSALTAKESAAQAEAAAAAAKVSSINEEIQGIKDLKQSLLEQYTEATNAGDAEKAQAIATDIASTETWLKEEASTAATAAEEARAAAVNAAAASEARETLATQINTAQTTGDTVATGFLTIAKEKLAAAAMKLNAVLAANKFAIIIGLTIALGYAIYKLITYETEAEKAQKAVNEAMNNAVSAGQAEKANLEGLITTMRTAKEGTQAYEQAKEAIINQYGSYLTGLIDEKNNIIDLEEAYNRLTVAIQNKAVAEGIQQATAKAQEAYTDAYTKANEAINKKLAEIVDTNARAAVRALIDNDLQRLGGLSTDTENLIYQTLGIKKSERNDADAVAEIRRQAANIRKTQRDYNRAIEKTRADYGVVDDEYANLSKEELARRREAIELALEYQEGNDIIVTSNGQVIESFKTRAEAQLALTRVSQHYSEKEKEDNRQKSELYRTKLAEARTERDEANAALKRLLADPNASAVDVERARTRSTEAEETYNKLSTGKKSGPTGKTAAELASEAQKAQQALTDLMKQQAEERLKLQQEAEFQQWQNRIDLMAEGEGKVIEQMRLDQERERNALESQKQQAIQAEIARQKAIFDAREEEIAAGKKKYAKKVFNPEADANQAEINAIIDRYDTLNTQLLAKQQKAEADRLEAAKASFNAYLQEFGTYQQKREAIEADYNKRIGEAANPGDRMMLEGQRRKALSDLDFDQWMSTGDIALAFGDLANLSNDTIDSLISDMEQYREKVIATFDPDKIAKYEEALTSLRQVRADDSFGIFAGAIPEYFKERKSVGSQLDSAGENVNAVYKKRAEIYIRIADIQERIKEATAKGENISSLQKELESAQVELNANSSAADNAIRAFKLLQEQWDKLDSPEAKFQGICAAVSTAADIVSDLSSQFSELADAMGAGGLASAAGTFGDIASSIGNVASAFASGDTIGGITAAAGAVMKWTASIFAAGDRKHEKNIQRIQEKIDALQNSYDRIGTSADKAFSTDASTLIDQQNTLLKQQKVLIQEQIAEEKAKKKTDKEKVKEYEERLEEIDELLAENADKAKEAIIGKDVKSAIEEFATLYAEAWDDGTDAAQKSMAAVKSIVTSALNELLKKNIQPAAQNFYDALAKAMEDGVLTDAELANLDAIKAQIDAAAAAGEGQYKKIQERYKDIDELREELTDISFDSVRDNFKSLLTDMESSSEDFSENFTDMLRDALAEGLMNNKYDAMLKEWYNEFAEAMEDQTLSDSERDALRQQYNAIVQQGIADRDALTSIVGGGAYSQQASSGTAWNMSQDTGEELNGRFTAMVELEATNNVLVADGNAIAREILVTLRAMTGISMVTPTTGDNETLLAIKDMVFISTGHLENIEKQSRNLAVMATDISEMKTAIKNL